MKILSKIILISFSLWNGLNVQGSQLKINDFCLNEQVVFRKVRQPVLFRVIPLSDKYEPYKKLDNEIKDRISEFSSSGTEDENIKQAEKIFGQSFGKMEEVAEKLRSEGRELKVAVLFATYNEAIRIQSQEESGDSNSEDALREKVKQLQELFEDFSDVLDWQLVMVDNHSTDNTFSIAQEIKENLPSDIQEKIILLQTPQEAKTEGWKKGGSVTYGINELPRREKPADFFIYTDADITTDLRQVGLLVGPMVLEQENVVIGSRAVEGSIALPPLESDNSPEGRLDSIIRVVSGKLKKEYLLKPIEAIKDTQAGFKGFSKEAANQITSEAEDTGFSFDTEYLTLALKNKYGISRVPILWINSEVLSHVQGSKPRWEMLKGWIGQYKRRKENGWSNQGFLKGRDPDTLTDKKLSFLEEYASKSLKQIDEGASISQQMEQWIELGRKFGIEQEKLEGWIRWQKEIEDNEQTD